MSFFREINRTYKLIFLGIAALLIIVPAYITVLSQKEKFSQTVSVGKIPSENALETNEPKKPSRDYSPVSTDLSKIEKKFHVKPDDLVNEPFTVISCGVITYLYEPQEELVSKLLDYVKHYRYSDERIIRLEDGSTTIENKGQTSERDIFYMNLCKSEVGYYVLYETEEKSDAFSNVKSVFAPIVNAAGGMSSPSNFGFIDMNGNLILIEDLVSQLPRIEVNWGKSGPYYGCRNIYGATRSTVLLGCGGGDGPGGVSSIFALDIKSKSITELTLCGNIDADYQASEEQRCYDKNGDLYYSENIYR